ncbi:PREDICTED: toll-like receptor 7 [Rhagoletis zephyria]|uniref:toll-like receptor 7 n=1 Tax=Rhagoletis zephyria TaxID=28612 RepID=UPI000811770C|nr:PREDICTED: toll-like receptor 7 [Rhagoletis zephyria]
MSRIVNRIRLLFILLPALSGLLSTHIADATEDITLKCDEFERMYEMSASEAYCTVSGFVVSHSQIVKIQKYAKANNTKFMKFYDSRLLYVPFKLFDVFACLKTLDVSFTEILDVPRNTFGAAGNLTVLNMSNNNITQITTSVFMGASNLMRLDLSHNHIELLNENAFRGLSSLDKLQLSYNSIRELPKDLLLENQYLEAIAINNNHLEYVEPEVFNRLRRLNDVNLSYNNIHRVHPDTFQAAYGLESLLLTSNNLTEFELGNKSILSQLQVDYNNLTRIFINGTKYVRADHNRIAEVQMINTLFLETLLLGSNNLSDIANITNITGLLQLDLSNNPIGPVNITTFDRLKRLRMLSLRAIGLQRLTFGMLSKQLSLESLDLSYNNLTELNLDIFVPYLSNLRYLFVDGNNLTEVQGKGGFSYVFPNLSKLGVSRNRFNCTYLHTLLVPPQLSTSVMLHIEPEESAAERAHIRDVSCISSSMATDRASLQEVEHELDDMTSLQKVLQQSMNTLRLHEQRLEVYLLLMKIALLAMIVLLIGVVAVYAWKIKRRDYFTRRGASIVFHSSATVNSNVEH